MFDERSPYNPYLNYGKSKKLMEDLLQEAFHSRKIDTVVLRPCWFYGPGQPVRQTRFFRMIREGKVPIVGTGESKRSLSYVDNICQALLLAEKAEAARGRIYWIADRRPYTMNEIVGTVERLLEQEFGKKVAHRRMHLPGFVSEIALLPGQDDSRNRAIQSETARAIRDEQDHCLFYRARAKGAWIRPES